MAPLRIPDPPPELIARAKRLYLETDTATDDIAKMLGLTPRTFRNRMRSLVRSRPFLAAWQAADAKAGSI